MTYILGFLTFASFATSWASFGWADDAIPEGTSEPTVEQIQARDNGNSLGVSTLFAGGLFFIFWLIALAAT